MRIKKTIENNYVKNNDDKEIFIKIKKGEK